MAENEQTRQSLLQAALQIFSERGFHDAKVSDIVKEAGVAQGTFYLYFKNKEAVFTSIIQTTMNSIIEQTERTLDPTMKPEATDEEIFDNLYQAVRGYMAIHREHQPILRMVRKHGAQFPEAVQVMENFEQDSVRMIRKLLGQFNVFPEYSSSDYEVVTYAINGLMKETCMKLLANQDSTEEDVSRTARVVAKLICAMTLGND